jgi:hypothetical protein
MEYGSVRLRQVREPTADVLEVCKAGNGAGRPRLSSAAGVVSRSVLCGRGEPGRGSHGAPDKAEAASFVFCRRGEQGREVSIGRMESGRS